MWLVRLTGLLVAIWSAIVLVIIGLFEIFPAATTTATVGLFGGLIVMAVADVIDRHQLRKQLRKRKEDRHPHIW